LTVAIRIYARDIICGLGCSCRFCFIFCEAECFIHFVLLINLADEVSPINVSTNKQAGLRRQNSEVMLKANIQALSLPSESKVLINDLKNMDLYMREIFKYTYGEKSYKLKEYKEFVNIQKAKYLVEVNSPVAWELLEKEGLLGFIDQTEPEIPLKPIIPGWTKYQMERKFFLKNLALIEEFVQKHHEFAYGKGAKNTEKCKIEVKEYQARFLVGFDNSTANELLKEKKLLDYLTT